MEIRLFISPTYGEPTPALKRARKAVNDATYTLAEARRRFEYAERRLAAQERTMRDVEGWLDAYETRERARIALCNAEANLRARMAALGRLERTPRARKSREPSRLPYVTGTQPRLGERSRCIGLNRCVSE